MTLFWSDRQRDVSLTYEDLVTELVERNRRHPVLYESDPSEVFVELLLAILGDADLTILDAEFSRGTLDELGYSEDVGTRTEPAPDIDLSGPEALPRALAAADDQWTLGLYTSGTTGVPSRVEQRLSVLTRSVRTGENHADDVWAFAYNPTHFAGLQVLFQAVSNLNPMIYVFEASPEAIGEQLRAHGVTHISATPTFYRLRLQQLNGKFPQVQRLTSGGERFEETLRASLGETFPNAAMRNVYATTEAGTVLTSDAETFEIPPERSEKFRVADDGELLLHRSLLADPGGVDLDGEWYHTGDVVRFVDDDQFRFVGRESDFVNVGGYRVNPHEVERRINDQEAVEAAVVTARESSVTGNILVARAVPAGAADETTVEDAVADAVADLERWKQPRIVDVVDSLDQSRSGKRVRGGDN